MKQAAFESRALAGAVRPERNSCCPVSKVGRGGCVRDSSSKPARRTAVQYQSSESEPIQRQSPCMGAGAVPSSPQEAFDLDVTSGPFPEYLELGEEIGRGTFGIVHKARDTRSGKEVAVKLLKKREGPFVNLGRIRNEVLAWRELSNHPHAVTFYGCYEDKDNIYLVQELCAGGDLRELFMSREGQCLEEIEVAQVAYSILQVITFCHEKCMCYQDIKPENFVLKCPYPGPQAFLDPKGPKGHIVLKAVDFGSVKMNVQSGKLRGENGSPLYRAPEAYLGPYGIEADVWSLGMLMYHLLCGRPAFVNNVMSCPWDWNGRMSNAMNQDALGCAITVAPLTFCGDEWTGVSRDAKDLLSKMLDRDVGCRISAQAALEHPWIKDNLARLEMESLLASFDSFDEEIEVNTA